MNGVTLRPRAGLALLLALCLGAAHAQEQAEDETRQYDVEVILFENLDVRAAGDERWRPQVVVPAFEEVAAFESAALHRDGMIDLPDGFRRLSTEDAQLRDAVERLEKSNRYRVIRHLLWRQPGLEADEAIPLRVHDGEPLEVRVPEPAYATRRLGPPLPPEEPAAGESGDGATAVDTEQRRDAGSAAGDRVTTDTSRQPRGRRPAGIPVRTRDVRLYPLDGTIRVVVSRYIHVHADFLYTTAVDWSAGTSGDEAGQDRGPPGSSGRPPIARAPDGQAMLTYPFDQQRRMRSEELHYLDHPVIGMIVVVRPHEDDEGAAADTASQ